MHPPSHAGALTSRRQHTWKKPEQEPQNTSEIPLGAGSLGSRKRATGGEAPNTAVASEAKLAQPTDPHTYAEAAFEPQYEDQDDQTNQIRNAETETGSGVGLTTHVEPPDLQGHLTSKQQQQQW